MASNNKTAAAADIPLADEGEENTVNVNSMMMNGEKLPKPANPLPRSPDEDETTLMEEDQEEKARLIAQVLELQNTLDDLSQRVDNVKEESLKLRSENQVLGQYIENLMAASTVFQSTSPKAKKK